MVKTSPVDLGLGCSAILPPGQQVAAVAAQQLPKLSELSQLEVLTILLGHPALQKNAQIHRNQNIFRGIYVTTDAVESFVERHYMAQITRLRDELSSSSSDEDTRAARTELLNLLRHCCEDEVDHKEEARERAAEGPLPWWPWVDDAWRWLVGAGSAAAANIAKRG